MSFFAQTGPSARGRLSEMLGSAIGQGVGKNIAGQQQQQQMQEQQGVLAQALFGDQAENFANLTVEQQFAIAKQRSVEQDLMQKSQKDQQRSQLLNSILGIDQQDGQQQAMQQQDGQQQAMQQQAMQQQDGQQQAVQQQLEQQAGQQQKRDFTEQEILGATVANPNLGRVLQSQSKEKTRAFEKERDYHTKLSQSAENKVESLRESIPRKENALDYARLAVESGKVGAFSINRLADSIGGTLGDALRTAKGAQLLTASKENLLSNMSRVSARAQNQWFEMKLNSMFPKLGQTKVANLTVQEMLEGELAMDKAYVETFDRLSQQDEQEFGYVRKDIDRRARKELVDIDKKIFQRSNYRLKNIEEKDLGIADLKKKVGKRVTKGTPMTITMAKLYKDKFGAKAIETARKNGYKIPKYEDIEIYQMSPREFRGSLGYE